MQDIIDAISKADLNEVKQISAAARARHKQLLEINNAVASTNFKPGDEVQFTRRSGSVIRGTVVKKLKKNILVRTDDYHEWRVPPSMLEHAP